MKRKTLSKKEKEIYNAGVKDACREILAYDGIIYDEFNRKYMSDRIKEKFSYKTPKCSINTPPVKG